jgi:AsmA protein
MEAIMSDKSGKKFGVLKITVIIIVLIVVVVLALPFFLDINQFRPEIESQLSKAFGREVKIGTLQLSLFSGNVSADEIVIADNPSFSKASFITANSFKIGVELKPLIFSREIRITNITLDQPAINLIFKPAGKWNFSDLGANMVKSDKDQTKGTQTKLFIKQLQVNNGRVSITEGSKKPSVYDEVTIRAENVSLTSSFPFTVIAKLPGEGTFKLVGNAGPLNETDTMQTPWSAELTIGHLDLVKAGFIAPDSGLSGLIDLKGNTTSNGRQVQSKGIATAEKLQIVKGGSPAGRPVSLNFAADYDLVKRMGTLREVKIGVGKAFAYLNGIFDARNEEPYIKMRLYGSGMPVQDLRDLLTAFAVTLPKGATLEGGTLKTDLSADGPLNNTAITGMAEISKTSLTGYDLSSKVAMVAQLAGFPTSKKTEIEKFTTSMRYSPAGIDVSQLQLIVPSLGTLTGAGNISPAQALNFTMQAQLTPSGGVGGQLTKFLKKDNLAVSFFVRGTSSDPKFVPDVKNTVRGLLDSVLSDKKGKEAPANNNDSLENTLRGLFKKK